MKDKALMPIIIGGGAVLVLLYYMTRPTTTTSPTGVVTVGPSPLANLLGGSTPASMSSGATTAANSIFNPSSLGLTIPSFADIFGVGDGATPALPTSETSQLSSDLNNGLTFSLPSFDV
jgi:hypothetical protein